MPLDDIKDDNGIVRRLGYVAPDSSKKMMRASRTNIQTIRSNAGLKPLIQPGDPEWMEVDFITGYPLDLITDQGQLGACTAFSASGSGARQRYIREGRVLMTSGFFIYDCINHGHDNGSNIIESMDTVERIGSPPLETYTKCVFPRNPPQPPAGALMYKEDVGITGSTAIEFATMLLMGILPQGPMMVTNQFEKWSGDGEAFNGGAPNTSNSNHSVYYGRLKFLNGDPNRWRLGLINSWRPSWGPFKNGTCLVVPAVIDNAADVDDGYGHASTPNPVNTAPAVSV